MTAIIGWHPSYNYITLWAGGSEADQASRCLPEAALCTIKKNLAIFPFMISMMIMMLAAMWANWLQSLPLWPWWVCTRAIPWWLVAEEEANLRLLRQRRDADAVAAHSLSCRLAGGPLVSYDTLCIGGSNSTYRAKPSDAWWIGEWGQHWLQKQTSVS